MHSNTNEKLNCTFHMFLRLLVLTLELIPLLRRKVLLALLHFFLVLLPTSLSYARAGKRTPTKRREAASPKASSSKRASAARETASSKASSTQSSSSKRKCHGGSIRWWGLSLGASRSYKRGHTSGSRICGNTVLGKYFQTQNFARCKCAFQFYVCSLREC